jgi:hypothetical protein
MEITYEMNQKKVMMPLYPIEYYNEEPLLT